jgi:hypothetical protein
MAEKKTKPPLIFESSESDKSDSDSSKTTESDIKSISTKSQSIPSSSTPISSSDSSLSSIEEKQLEVSNEELETEFKGLDCNDEKLYSNDCNKFLLKKELLERNYLKENEEVNASLYPNLNDIDFNVKIASKKEFNDTKYDGTIHNNIKEHADALANADFEIQPHQAFVKNFMSFQTPYNSLLLFHGLGSGKTCSAIGVCEEMRDYMKQMGINKRIIIVASENVQDNFKLQLFDERKLKLVDGVWNIRACTGNKLLKEINPMNMKGMTKEKVISQIKTIINTYYIFLGYVQFANYIIKTMNYEEEVKKQAVKGDERKKQGQKSKIQMLKDIKIELNSRIIKRLSNEFDNRLIVIDEVHNIRKTDDNENKKVALNLELLVKAAKNMRFLLLSATPMYNSYKEIAWLLNLMNTNDRRGRIKVSDVFDKKGEIKNEELLIRKATGYISFVRGENPYTFPYRVYPNEFAKDNTFPAIKYPSFQMNLKKIKHEDKKRVLSLYLTKMEECNNCGKCQYCVYRYIIFNLRNKKFSITTKTGQVRDMPSFENMESFGYTLLQTPLESLIISYPISGLKNVIEDMPRENLSDDFSPSFSELKGDDEVEEVEESPGPVVSKGEEGEEESDIVEPVVEQKKKPALIFEDSDDDSSWIVKQNPDISVVKQDSDDDTDELKKEKVREAKKKLIIESSSEESKKSEEGKKTEKKTTTFNKKTPLVVEYSDSELTKTLSERNPKTLSDSEKPIASNKTLSDSEKPIASNKTLSDPEKQIARSHQGQPTSGGKKSDSSSSSAKASFHIDPHQLTGKAGLERMMNFVDEKSPPVKGDFEYKRTTLDTYGKIFSREEIGKYSIKIKSILDNIYNQKTGTVSEGVILIYSQYIDSGLIPMALALEEMGFTRYGQQGIKPLFKDRPSDLVDVRTMKPPEDKKDFMPARYSMITGDPRLSPNNDFEIKGLTDDNKVSGNIDGNKVKVVLISKAGSEGIDFKFIRQIHILEPWYNMNRIEQIIGRGVRNFSHKDLPFEKRNVEIFMYGTILGENKEEAADLYVYRVAEYKAVQIGKVTRVLKETAVDCIINHGQNNFTQTKMAPKIDEPITQILSNGITLNDFKIGDAPFSPACDYMADCNFNCRPGADIDENNLNEDTYDEKFIIINSEKILQKIRMLMKESFFYKKQVLIDSINIQKKYPDVQIYSALTQLIEDENEFIVDRYGRNGRLVNIGEYYLFQPVELRDKNASIYDRSVPIDYKNNDINFELKQNIVKPVIDKRNVEKMVIEEPSKEADFPEGKKLVDEMIINYNITLEFMKKTKVPRGDDDWFKHCGIVIKKMSKEYPDSKPYLLKFLIAHVLEQLVYDDKVFVMNYLYSLEDIERNSFEWFAKEYFENNSIIGKKHTAYIMYKLSKPIITILNKDNKWVPADPEDQREIFASKEGKELVVFKKEEYNKFVGFIGYEKSNRYLVFKIKDMTSTRDTGARCDEAGKAKNIAKLNEIIGEEKYDNENTKAVKDADGNVISEAVGNTELCVTQEFILRYFNAIKKDDYKWFLTPEMAILYKLYKVFV